ncbi:uncharacterized protein MKK02DRAFT_37716 [Dioszegia hungarica]|uniref:F-box domain-containing protein n=1 Tax=Dioszegia hungarica TaxID=4972 RepID=A0AA38H649_9TREE|nr:uncharacterized protein MKK02DRAFT_37716 [Dioszegia hungarica]KAI9634840.1 hypothetical protein MKK02DRAFT_37716 [Dioszegia hungarica]
MLQFDTTISAPPISLLDLPHELLLDIIRTHLAVPGPTPRIVFNSPLTADAAPLKMTCRRLKYLTEDVEKGKKDPVSSILYDALTPLAQLLDLPLEVHALTSLSGLLISALPAALSIHTALDSLPTFARCLPTDTIPRREAWTVLVPPDMSFLEIEYRLMGLACDLYRRVMRCATPVYTARIMLKYDPELMGMEARRELTDVIRQRMIGLMGGDRVTTDYKSTICVDM